MIKELKLENFRCFSDHTVPFNRTTVVIGRNNAGKSTLVEALRLVAIVASRYRSLSYNYPVDWRDIPRRDVGVSPSLKGLEFNFRSMFYRYGDPPAIITATFDNDTSMKIYIVRDEKIHAVIYDSSGCIAKSRSDSKKIEIPHIEIMPQVAPVARDETVLTDEYIKSALSSRLAPLHFRNQLKVLSNYFPAFKEMSETTWPGLQIQELIYDRGYPGDQIQLIIRDEDFVAEVGDMGHGLQMWLQTMWFLTRSSGASTVILDEPDVYMHPDLQRRLIRFVKNKHPQVIVTTHSVEIMSEVDVDEILIIDKKKPRSRFAGTLPAVQKLIEHIGSVHNINLAKLWHSQRCILVEGKDIKFLSEIHNILYPESSDSLSSYPNMPIGGWGGWSYAIGSSMLLKNAGGQSIEVYCILDSDYHTKEEREKRMKEAVKAGVHLHIWSSKEIENYCLDPIIIQRTIQSRISKRKKASTEEEIIGMLEKIIEDQKNVVFDALSTEILARERNLGAGGANKKAREQLEKAWKTIESKTRIVSGKEVLSQLSKWSQETYGVSLSVSIIARQMKADEVPIEMVKVVDAIEKLEIFSN
ncbi:MAG: AAA family ATPase [Candidatus Aminicenantes bacterium]|nr:AAA family ATPase [Candidatus Aminicenantes bacterium]